MSTSINFDFPIKLLTTYYLVSYTLKGYYFHENNCKKQILNR